MLNIKEKTGKLNQIKFKMFVFIKNMSKKMQIQAGHSEGRYI